MPVCKPRKRPHDDNFSSFGEVGGRTVPVERVATEPFQINILKLIVTLLPEKYFKLFFQKMFSVIENQVKAQHSAESFNPQEIWTET